MLAEDENEVSLQSTGQYQLTYKEGARTMLLETEGGSKNEYILFHKWMRWEKPHDNEELSIEDLGRIMNNIREAMILLTPNKDVVFKATRY
jgi:hypothetical protein